MGKDFTKEEKLLLECDLKSKIYSIDMQLKESDSIDWNTYYSLEKMRDNYKQMLYSLFEQWGLQNSKPIKS